MSVWIKPETSTIDLGRVHARIDLGLKICAALLITFSAALVLVRAEVYFSRSLITQDMSALF